MSKSYKKNKHGHLEEVSERVETYTRTQVENTIASLKITLKQWEDLLKECDTAGVTE